MNVIFSIRIIRIIGCPVKPLPTLKQLEYLTALADTLHFGRAAERCNVTPSTLSAGIQDLESALGVPVAERTKRKVLITPLGAEVAQRARRLLRDAGDMVELAAAARAPLTGNLRLGIIPTVGPFLLPRILPGLRARYPDLRFFLQEELSLPLLEQLRNGALDAAMIALPFATGDVATRILFDDEFLFACDRNHPLAGRPEVAIADLAGETLMLLEEGHCLRTQVLDVCRSRDFSTRSGLEASSFHTLVHMVGFGIGVTLLPRLAVDAGIADARQVALVPMVEAPKRQIALAWRQSSLRQHEFDLLRQVIQEILAVPVVVGTDSTGSNDATPGGK